MSVGRICQREVDTAEWDEPVQTAAQRMAARNVGSLVVLDVEARPVGILTDRDLALRIVAAGRDSGTTKVGEIQTGDPGCISEDTPIEDALARMRRLVVRRLPVVDPDGTLVGVVSLDDVLALIAEELGEVGRLLEASSPRSFART